MVLSTLAQFDDLGRLATTLSDGAEPEFLKFVQNQDGCRQQWLQAVRECQRLQAKLTDSNHALSEMESKLEHARNLLDQEKKYRRIAEQERDSYEKQICLVRDMLEHNNVKLNDETKEKFAFLNNTSARTHRVSEVRPGGPGLDVINELESTGSILSELGLSQSEEDVDVSLLRSGKPRRRSGRPCLPEDLDFVTPKRRRSSRTNKSFEVLDLVSGQHVVATTTVTVAHNGPITASSKLEAIPSKRQAPPVPSAPPMPTAESEGSSEDSFWQRAGTTKGQTDINLGPAGDAPIGFPSTMSRINTRAHVFCTKNIIRPETCGPCGRKIKFAKTAMKCVDCRAVCHPECKDGVPLPCVPMGTTPSKKMCCIADYTPMVPPMVPAIVVHCVQEVEKRGSSEVGLYRVPGSERDVKSLKERFLKGRGAPDLSGTDLPVVCSALKEFLKSLREPLITQSQWSDFTRACDHRDSDSVRAALYTCIAELPQPNRDTLAFLITHLQRVASWDECKMPIGNLAKVFGPTVVGYTSDDMDAARMVTETRMQQNLMTQLLNIPTDYWTNFLNRETSIPVTGDLRGTPSSSSLNNRESSQRPGFFSATPRSARLLLGKRDKFFSTPQ